MTSRHPALFWPRRRRSTDPFTDFDGDGLFVFVPAIMSVGIVFSVMTLVRDAFRWTGARARQRRTAMRAHTIVVELVGDDEGRAEVTGAVGRSTYLSTGLLLGSVSGYIAIGSLANYLRADGYVHDIGWLFALALCVSTLLGFVAIASLTMYRTAPNPPSWAERALRSMALSVHPDRVGYGPPVALTIAIVVTATTTFIIALMVASGRGLAGSIDQPIVDWLTDVEWLDRLAPFDPFGSTLVSLAMVGIIGLSGFRCRVMAVVYPAAFAVAWLSVEVLQHTIDRERPSGYGGFESFPSGHMVQVVFITGLLPLALGALVSNRRLVVVSRTVLIVATIATGIHRIFLAKHWPLDIIGGLTLGATVVLGVHWTLEHRGWHQACNRCPWSTHPATVEWKRGVIDMSPETSRRIGRVGAVLAVGAAIGLGVLTLLIGLPRDPEGSGLASTISSPVQLSFAAIVAIAGLLARRWAAVAAILMAVAAVGLAVFASVQYVPQLAFLLGVVLLVPSVLTWLSWQPHASLGSIATVAVLTVSALTGTGLGVREVHEHFFGPSHPSSLTAPLRSDAEWLWLGGVGTDMAVVTAGGFEPGTRVSIEYWSADAPADRRQGFSTVAGIFGLARFELASLAPSTSYRYRVVAGDQIGSEAESATMPADAGFRTFAEGPQDLEIVMGACARRASNGAVFDALVAEDADLYLALGDLHYGNLESADPAVHVNEYGRSLRQPAQAALFSSIPTAYVWDDHDYGPNDADRGSPSRDAVAAAYRAAVPSYGLDPDQDVSIAHAFTIGRVRVIMTDTRSQRDETTMLGEEQLAWLLEELVEASETHAVVVWANPTPWVGQPTSGGDSWASYPDERAEIAQTIADADIGNLVMVSGDAHMVAIDDGSNTGYAADGDGGFPLLHAAALDRPGSTKGGPYSHGAFPGGGQYGRISIEDTGSDRVNVRLSGHRWDGAELVSLDVEIDVPAGAGSAT